MWIITSLLEEWELLLLIKLIVVVIDRRTFLKPSRMKTYRDCVYDAMIIYFIRNVYGSLGFRLPGVYF